MNLFILRHGIAVEPGTHGYEKDADRPLTPEGERKLLQIAEAMEALDLTFDLILSSPYLRARQTAEIVAEALRQGLEEENHTVALASDGLEGIHAAETCDFDAILLDVMMPGMDGIRRVRRLRAAGRQTPVLMLTARDAAGDVVRGLDAGADDYLTKPFSFRVLLARLRAISRRSAQPPKARLQVDDLLLDPASHEVWRAGVALNLTATEY